MNDVIKLLPDSVANQIAAGEVIQRPASVVKELVENAIDAGATIVKLNIKDAGRTLIQVTDNGCGMSPTDARLAFDRHSTSKITVADDLFSLHTMGFRGEALASICAVSEVELKTMRRDDTIGTRIVISGSKVVTQEPVSATPGSTMMVKRLFFNVPARRKFLKSDPVEMTHILREFERLALVNPTVELELVHNDTLIHRLLKGSLKQRIVDLFGKSLDAQLIPIGCETSIVKIEGFVCRPENARKRGALQYLMVNGRNMKHLPFRHAVASCYEKLIANDAQPNYFINFTVDPQTIDVNIHPTKSEIKFENEQPIWQILNATIKEALGKFNAAPAIDFTSTDTIDLPVFNPDPEADHSLGMVSGYNPFKATSGTSAPSSHKGGGTSWSSGVRTATADWNKLYDAFLNGRDNEQPHHSDSPAASAINDVNDALFESEVMPHSSLMQFKNRYILTSGSAGLMIIDQHRAHISVLYHQFISMARDNKLSSQRLIFPDTLSMTATENQQMEILLPHLNRLGFEITHINDNTWEILGLPAVLASVNTHELIADMLSVAEESGNSPDANIVEQIALGMARAGAIKSEQQLSDTEMDHLVNELFRLSNPTYCPDGHINISIISQDDINRLFS